MAAIVFGSDLSACVVGVIHASIFAWPANFWRTGSR